MVYFLISLISFLAYFLVKYKRVMHMYQQNRYHYDTYFNWLKVNFKEAFLGFDILFLMFTLLMFINYKLSTVIFFVFYLVCFVISLRTKREVKKPLVFTARVKRMYVVTLLILFVMVFFIVLNFDRYYVNIYYLLIGLFAYISYLLVVIVNIINIPVEKSVVYYYKRKAINKLKGMECMDVIGITGSYGKTSSKNILNDILNSKFNAMSTPKNYNTPGGVMITINNYLDKFNDYFIVEMGACRVGEIKELCELVSPKYGILTKVGQAHLETFKSVDNILKTKFELIESLPRDGIAILNGDDELQKSYKLKNEVKCLWIGIDNKDVDLYATDIVLSHKGTKFKCVFKGDKKKYEFETKILGKANIYNILAGVLLGKNLGISIDELVYAVKRVMPVEHRLEMKKQGDIYIIDDAYNSNPVGSKMAIDVLSMMKGKRIVVTPGMVELGGEEYKLNYEFGSYMKGKVDVVVLIGKEQTRPIYEGIKASGFDMDNVHVLNDIKDAFGLINEIKDKETYVLLENDLPDLFNERKV